MRLRNEDESCCEELDNKNTKTIMKSEDVENVRVF